MSRSMIAAAAVAAAAALTPQMPAAAQESGIVVAAPRVQSPDQPKFSVTRPVRLTAHVWVPTADLDLRTAYGRSLLDYRLKLAAYQACSQLRSLTPGGVGSMMNPDPQDCRQNAYKNAQRGARYLVWDAG